MRDGLLLALLTVLALWLLPPARAGGDLADAREVAPVDDAADELPGALGVDPAESNASESENHS